MKILHAANDTTASREKRDVIVSQLTLDRVSVRMKRERERKKGEKERGKEIQIEKREKEGKKKILLSWSGSWIGVDLSVDSAVEKFNRLVQRPLYSSRETQRYREGGRGREKAWEKQRKRDLERGERKREIGKEI